MRIHETAHPVRPHRRRTWTAALLVLAVLSTGVQAAERLHGRVVAISDGDTLRLLVDEGGEKLTERVRLGGIDCPERRQPWGTRAKQGLSDLAYGQDIVVRWNKRDRYQRIVGTVLVGEPPIDANLALVEDGLCWWYRKYAHEQSPDDRILYEAAEDRARAARRGLWSDPDPVPPWEWRRR